MQSSQQSKPSHSLSPSQISGEVDISNWDHGETNCKATQQQIQQPCMFVALYDFHGSDASQLTLRKGDKVKILGYNKTREWCEAQYIPNTTSIGGNQLNFVGNSIDDDKIGWEIGWVPTLYVAPMSILDLDKQHWYHGGISRSEAELLLGSGINGSFLVRDSETSPGQFSISVRHEGRVFHYRINTCSITQKFFISPDSRFRSLGELVAHHGKAPYGLVCTLHYPISRTTHYPQKRSTSAYSVTSTSDIFLPSPTPPDNWEIERTEIIMNNKLGCGQYGDVYQAWWKPREPRCGRTVAVKTLKEDAMALPDFLAEASFMKELNHPSLIRLLGLCSREPPYFIILEFMDRGNLLQYLRETQKNLLPQHVLLNMAAQVASGMAYMEARNFIHRDLAARNCLVGTGELVKIGDFGLARCLRNDDTYTAKPGAKFPIKWTAPEGLSYNTFSTKSDVWSFGILLWEIITLGQAPYPGVELMDVFTLLEKGFRMDRPEYCPERVYRLMLQCWNWSPSDRPLFRDLSKSLDCFADELCSTNSSEAINEEGSDLSDAEFQQNHSVDNKSDGFGSNSLDFVNPPHIGNNKRRIFPGGYSSSSPKLIGKFCSMFGNRLMRDAPSPQFLHQKSGTGGNDGNNNFTFLPKLQRPPPSKLVHKLSTQRSFSTFHPENDVSDDEESKCRVQNPSLLASSSSIATNLSSSRSREFDNVQRTPIFETEHRPQPPPQCTKPGRQHTFNDMGKDNSVEPHHPSNGVVREDYLQKGLPRHVQRRPSDENMYLEDKDGSENLKIPSMNSIKNNGSNSIKYPQAQFPHLKQRLKKTSSESEKAGSLLSSAMTTSSYIPTHPRADEPLQLQRPEPKPRRGSTDSLRRAIVRTIPSFSHAVTALKRNGNEQTDLRAAGSSKVNTGENKDLSNQIRQLRHVNPKINNSLSDQTIEAAIYEDKNDSIDASKVVLRANSNQLAMNNSRNTSNSKENSVPTRIQKVAPLNRHVPLPFAPSPVRRLPAVRPYSMQMNALPLPATNEEEHSTEHFSSMNLNRIENSPESAENIPEESSEALELHTKISSNSGTQSKKAQNKDTVSPGTSIFATLSRNSGASSSARGVNSVNLDAKMQRNDHKIPTIASGGVSRTTSLRDLARRFEQLSGSSKGKIPMPSNQRLIPTGRQRPPTTVVEEKIKKPALAPTPLPKRNSLLISKEELPPSTAAKNSSANVMETTNENQRLKLIPPQPQHHVYSGIHGEGNTALIEGIGIVASSHQAINKDINNLHYRIKTTLQDLIRNYDIHSPTLTSAKTSTSGVSSSQSKTFHKIIDLCEQLQQFHDTCTIYAENITPHSKFRFKELLSKMETFIRHLRLCCCSPTISQSTSTSRKIHDSSSSADRVMEQRKALTDVELITCQIIHLVNR